MQYQTVPVCEHPANPDPSAIWVSGMHEPGMIFRVRGGYLAVLPDQTAILDLFETETEARKAIAERA